MVDGPGSSVLGWRVVAQVTEMSGWWAGLDDDGVAGSTARSTVMASSMGLEGAAVSRTCAAPSKIPALDLR